jgi:hypothetical protein
MGSVGFVYDRLPFGQLLATRQREFTSSMDVATTRVEWRHAPLGGFTVRYIETRATNADASPNDQASKLVELDLPSLTSRRPDSRLDLRAGLSGDASSTNPALSSKLQGKFAVFDAVALGGETELALAHGDGQLLRALRLTTEVAVMRDTGIRLLYTYGTGALSYLGQGFEARVTRTFSLFAW